MKGKKGTYILLAIVCIIWIGIAIEIITAFSPENETTSVVNIPISNRKIQEIEKEIFSIQTVDRDPFLGTLRKKKIPKKVQKKKIKPQKTVKWPNVKYKGTITDKNNKIAVFLIEINGSVQLMKKGNIQSELTLIKGNTSSITLLYKKERKEFSIIH